jgi:hypothetical protein
MKKMVMMSHMSDEQQYPNSLDELVGAPTGEAADEPEAVFVEDDEDEDDEDVVGDTDDSPEEDEYDGPTV